MAYTALYRKFRPQVFDDVKGQDHIVTTLKNQIKANRIGHAYLFCGTRGTGKTTVAKILAKAVNCEHPVDGSPCGECAMCRAIAAGADMNVMEIDAASNNGVDNIRQIREEVEYRPAEGRYRVYIIDEVHMLSTGAFNALLKTLEEPPEYVIFILATTEANKIPITIMSRCQRYDFHRITIDTIASRLRELMDTEGVAAEDRALRYIARAGDGSMRDSLSLLDQCIAFYMGQELTYDKVLDVLGAVDSEVFSGLLRAICDQDAARAIAQLGSLIEDGREMGQLVSDFVWYMRNLLLLQSSDDMEDVLDISSENLAVMKEEAARIPTAQLMHDIRVFSEVGSQMRYSTQKRVLMEIAIIRLCRPQMEVSYDAILDRLERVEQKLKDGVVISQESVGDIKASVKNPGAAAGGPEPHEKAVPERAVPDDVKKVVKEWRSILSECGGITKVYLSKGIPTLGSNNELMVVIEDETAYEYLSKNRADSLVTLKEVASRRVGKEVDIVIRKNDTGQRAKDVFPDLRELSDKIHFDNIEIEDDFEN
ncbi:MAG: DNA polymerase III subunit gamma/tau [Clostridiales bacterium]|nr:DNA polymerase III subunit gamma/tau [Clostridiales bacterium]